MKKIQLIVEGHGEVAAAPVLLRRLIAAAEAWEIDIGRPIRRNRGQLVKQSELEQSVRLALLQPGCGAVLIMFDGDRDCPAKLGPTVHQWAVAEAGSVPCEVVMPHGEYEAWFLSAIESLRGHRGIRLAAAPHPKPEMPRGAKGQLEARMSAGRSYLETADQPAFSAMFSMEAAYAQCRSFRKLTSSFGALLRAMGQDIGSWPPDEWTEHI